MELSTDVSSSPAAPPLSRRSQQKEETHERIVRAALHLFEKRGFAATRTQDIAEEAGISHGSIFVHFRTRDELLIHVCQRFLTAVDAQTRQGLRGSEQFRPHQVIVLAAAPLLRFATKELRLQILHPQL